ncbi:P-loop containing nucleoside triphosphate hydrolase protein [Ramaria rubella]|nr:P-loop containing nucleoside triphosphate hydrolase protein [Ramaria rubella]
MSTDNTRAFKLKKHFDSIIRGRQTLTRMNYTLFIEAICATPDPPTCISDLVTSSNGLTCLQQSMRFDLSPTFYNGTATQFFQYISMPELTNIGGGSFLQKVLLVVVEPPIFWNSFLEAFRDGLLTEDAQMCFAWLLLQLISLPGDHVSSYRTVAQDSTILDPLLSASHHDTRVIAQKIKHVIGTYDRGASVDLDFGPGGGHDNDFINFREIAILPTADELISKEKPFLRPSAMLEDPSTEHMRITTHLDNQFRLLREDMVYEMREELQVAPGLKKGKHRGIMINGLVLQGIHLKLSDDKNCKWGMIMRCLPAGDPFKNIKPKDRDAYLKDNRNFFRHQSMCCLFIDGEIVTFPTIHRVESLLLEMPPRVVIQFDCESSTTKALLKLHRAKQVRLVQVDTAVFSYEPVLRALQEKRSLYLSKELLYWTEDSHMPTPANSPSRLIEAIRNDPYQDLQPLLKTTATRPIKLDKAQAASLLSSLTQRVSLIQGPPGTGKSFIAALLAKVLHDSGSQRILVVCYTNHALDQFLEDLLDIGIPQTSIVRLGGKATSRTASLALQHQAKISKLGRAQWQEITKLKQRSRTLSDSLIRTFQTYRNFNASKQLESVLEHLHFNHEKFYEAFCVSQSTDGMQRVGKKGQAMKPDYLLSQWVGGSDVGTFKNHPDIQRAKDIWNMSSDCRKVKFKEWKEEMLKEIVESFYGVAKTYDDCQTQIDRLFGEGDIALLRSKRIIGCTTTGAAKYREGINAAQPGVLLVEEAGEILESHILTALGSKTQQLILIGDHKQLRPKVNNYMLTVEKNEGYPHETLQMQHRMRPEISALVRELTYPELTDAAGTLHRPDLRGVLDNIVFINHDKPEDEMAQLEERHDLGAKSSKQNKFEVQMVLKIVRYLSQQGYGTGNIVVLTPYLGQLRELQMALMKDNDPILNDLDSHDLVRAGLVSSSAAGIAKKPLRLATIDNYQGEESDIVIVSLTRSNATNDIGFMYAPERLTVLLSRARNALIMLGNAHTFANARKGNDIWRKLFDLLKHKGHIYDGFPVRCERHTIQTALLKCSDDFEKECPDGGCLEPCTTILKCGVHRCPSKCHQLSDHSKLLCQHAMFSKCPIGHPQQWECHKGSPVSCRNCEDEKRKAAKKQKDDFLHAQKIAELDARLAQEREVVRDSHLAEERARAIQQKEQDLKDAAILAARISSGPQTTPPSGTLQQTEFVLRKDPKTNGISESEKSDVTSQRLLPQVESSAQADWERQKLVSGESNNAIDNIMDMKGLENVKLQVLKIKDKVETSKRQQSNLDGERFNVAMLGNPGTGKTTIARHYGRFLATVQVIPGTMFIETSGSRLAQDGIPGIKKQIEEVINAGGGVVFIDEAYQLTSQHNFQGGQVLDFLLAEMENHIGKIVFIFAGYNKEMEKFFQHNPGLISRVPYSLQFHDYEDNELLDILQSLIQKTWEGNMKVEGGIQGLYGRIAIRRLGQGRGRNGFGNARAVANLFAKIRERQSERLSKERKQGNQPDDFLLVKEDLIGPDPSKVMVESTAWKKLQSMIGLTAVKRSITSLFSMADTNYQRELIEKRPHQVSLNRVFLGSPGTGKTTVAKHYGQILADLGLISNGEVIVKNPADFIGSALGQSESQTKAILATTVGKVLIIDEAYMLYGGSGSKSAPDPYKTAVIDTIVAEVQSVPGEDRCVLLLGYKHQIEEMFQNVNPGLARRFAIEDAFHFHDYSDAELRQALEWKLKDQDLSATEMAKDVAIEVLSRARNRPNFGNIGEVENLLTQTKMRYQQRQATLPIGKRSSDAPFEPPDFDPDHDRGLHSTSNLVKLFEDVTGCQDVVEKLRKYQIMAQSLKACGKDPRSFVPTNFVFKGPPGTGKTTTARKMGQVYYDMGFLSSTEVVECSTSDLVGQYVGQTGPKTRDLFEKALGRVLFIDEAYRLSEGHFAKEAMDELVGILTQSKYRTKLVVILAGYDQEMNELMARNPGLSSRFPEEIIFHDMPPEQCLEVLKRKLEIESIHIDALDDPSCAEHKRMVELLGEIASLPSWGNARDVETLSRQMVEKVYCTPSTPSIDTASNAHLTLAGDKAMECIHSMLSLRKERAFNMSNRLKPSNGMEQTLQEPEAPTLRSMPNILLTSGPLSQPEMEQRAKHQPVRFDVRDAGVSDEVWHQLQIDKQKAKEAIKRHGEMQKQLELELREATEREEAARGHQKELLAAQARDIAEREEILRQREEARLREHAAKAECAIKAAAIAEEERKRKEEARIQSKLCSMGVCVAGYRWVKQSSGYRCQGGSHFIENVALGL